MRNDPITMIQERLERSATPELSEETRRITERISQAIAEYGYGEWRSIVLDGVSGGLNSPIGSRNPVNILPATDSNDACQEILLAIASGLSKKSGSGLSSVLRQMRVHLLKCKNTRVVFIVADAWDPAVYEESKPDVEQHLANGVVFVRLDVMGERRVTPIVID
jgi:hypothetical protein